MKPREVRRYDELGLVDLAKAGNWTEAISEYNRLSTKGGAGWLKRLATARKLRALEALVPDINALEPEIERLTDEALRAKTPEFRQRLDNGEELDDLDGDRRVASLEDDGVAASAKRYVDALLAALDQAAEFEPDMVFISAGFDAARNDPIGGFTLEPEHFARLTHEVVERTRNSAEGKVISLLEGGYNPAELGRCVTAHLTALTEAAREEQTS